jgi:hypothetical protein
MGFNGTNAPAYWYRLKVVEDKFRYYFLSVLYWFIFVPMINFLSSLAPHNNVILRYWS